MNGVLLIDKPTGLTSHDVVYKARRALGIKSIGHAGTLDPLASGLLVLLVGEGTKVSDYLLNGDKGYLFDVRLGLSTDSMDITGEVVEERTVAVSEAQVREACASLSGALSLEVPVHSAVKVDGQKLYKLAHRGERPESVPVREMNFYDVEVVEVELPRVRVRLKCSKGSFIRAWANHLGVVLGCGGTIETLRREFSSPFNVSQAISIDELQTRTSAAAEKTGSALTPAWIPLPESLPHFKRVEVRGRDEQLMLNGQIPASLNTELLRFVTLDQTPPPVRVLSGESGDLLALLVAEPGVFYKVRRVFRN